MNLGVMPPVAPMLAKPVAELPDGAFSFEPKWDGFRTIVFRDGDEVELGSRNERPLTRYFPELVAAVKAHLPARCVIDGEIVVPEPCWPPRPRPAWSPSICWPSGTWTGPASRSAGGAQSWSAPSPGWGRRST